MALHVAQLASLLRLPGASGPRASTLDPFAKQSPFCREAAMRLSAGQSGRVLAEILASTHLPKNRLLCVGVGLGTARPTGSMTLEFADITRALHDDDITGGVFSHDTASALAAMQQAAIGMVPGNLAKNHLRLDVDQLRLGTHASVRDESIFLALWRGKTKGL